MVIRYFALVIITMIFSGCAGIEEPLPSGLLYTNIIQPHSTDFSNTPVGTKRCVLDEHKLKEPVSGGYSVEWTTDSIRVAAEEAGIANISYTEIQTVSFLLGTYSRRRMIIYGN